MSHPQSQGVKTESIVIKPKTTVCHINTICIYLLPFLQNTLQVLLKTSLQLIRISPLQDYNFTGSQRSSKKWWTSKQRRLCFHERETKQLPSWEMLVSQVCAEHTDTDSFPSWSCSPWMRARSLLNTRVCWERLHGLTLSFAWVPGWHSAPYWCFWW